MFRNNRNSKLSKYLVEEKRHYKLYKRKKVWVVAGVLLFSSAAFVPTVVSADMLNPTDITTEQTTTNSDEQTTAMTEDKATQTSEETPAVSEDLATSESKDASSVTTQTSEGDLTGQTSEVAQASQVMQASPSSAPESTSEADTPATVANEAVETAATTADEYYTGDDVVKLQNVTNGSNLGTITTDQATDGSTIYTYHATATGVNQTKVGMTVTYTGKKGDTFTMIVTPSNSQLTGFADYIPTGSPKIEKLANGVISYTWTIDGSADISTVTQELTAAGSLFYESGASANDAYAPYQGSGEGNSAVLATGDYYQIDFLINGIKAPAETNVKIMLEKELQVLSTTVSDFIDNENKIAGVSQVNPNTNYLYKASLDKDTAKYNLRLQEYYLEIPVPEHFLLDTAETEKMLRSWPAGDQNMYGTISITQPGGEGTPVVVKSLRSLASGSEAPEIYFVGYYTSTETSGKSDSPSGWYDLGDGQRHYFGKINVDTREVLETPLAGTGFDQKVLPVGSQETTEYYEVDLRLTNDQQTSSVISTHAPGYSNNYTDRTSSQLIGLAEIKTPISESGDPSAPVLFAVGLNASGATTFTPTYHIELPTQITSTGITMPLNNATDDFADYRAYNPAQSGYTVVVTGDDGSTVTQHLLAGENYNPLTGLIDHFGTFRTGAKLAQGVKIVSYDITPDDEYFANAFQSTANSSGINDIATGMISVLGYLNTTANADEKYVINIDVTSEHRQVPFELTVVPIASQKLQVQGYNYPGSSVGTGTNQDIKHAGDQFTIGLQIVGKRYTPQSGVNLDAGGILTGNANRTETDLPGHGLNVPYLTVKDPILYFTLPDQTHVTNFKNSSTFYKVTNPPTTGVPAPKILYKTNTDGQTVLILDWTGTGFELLPAMTIEVNLEVDEDAINGFDTARTGETLYEYTAPGKAKDLYTAAQLEKLGVSTEGLRSYQANVNSESNTTWIQVGGDFSNTELPASYRTQIKFSDNTVAKTMILDSASNGAYLRIVAPAVVTPKVKVQGTSDQILNNEGVNYPTQDHYEVNGETQGLQKIQFGVSNNTDDGITNVVSILNLPQLETADSNNETAKHEFTLNISGAGTLGCCPVNNFPQDEHTLYYVTQLGTLSDDGQTVIFADGTTWSKGESALATMLTAAQVTDWAQIKSLLIYVPSMTKESEILYEFSAYSPTSVDNAGKQAVLTQVVGYDEQASLLKNSVTDTYAVYASMQFVDQEGNPINGHLLVTGQAILNQQTGTYEVSYPDLIGAPGEKLSLGTPDTITGYKYTRMETTSTIFTNDGSTVVTRIYQVDQAKLLVGSLTGTLLATATGDPNANTGNNYTDTPTGVTVINFGITDEQLNKAGHTYTVTVVDLNGKRLVDSNGQSEYATLAQALAAQGIFDATNDQNGATQNFIINYKGMFQQAVIISENDPADLLPKTSAQAQTKAPFYSNGKTAELMFYDEAGNPLISDETMIDGKAAFKRDNYHYTVIAPDGRSYNSLAEALAAKLTFDATDNSGQVDNEPQVYRIVYAADVQTLRVTLIDDHDDRPLVSQQALGTGLSNAEVTPETKQALAELIKQYTDQGYVVVSQNATPDNYDDDLAVDQEIVVHLNHNTLEQAGESKTITQTIAYLYASGPNKGQPVIAPNIQTFTFTSTQIIDQVTGEILDTIWSPAQSTQNVVSPVIAGYTNDQATVAANSITATSEDQVITVSYNALEQVLTYTVIDDTTQAVLAKNVELATGSSEMPVDPEVATAYQAVIASYLAKGYELVSADQLPENYDTNTVVAQNVIIHLEHGQKTQAGAKKVVTQTITYVYGNGPKKAQSAAETYTKTYTFTSVETLDTVTGEVLATSWSAPQETQTVVSPTLSGYLPSQSEVASQTLTHESVDQTATILYTVGPQNVQIHYVDVYGVAPGEQGVELTPQLQTLTGAAGSAYTNQLWDYAAAGYELREAQPEAVSGLFDEDPEAAQDYYVYLTHALHQVTGDPVTVSQTINYVYGTGPKAGQLASDPVKQSHTFIPTYTVDQVTGQNVGGPTWLPATVEFNAVVSPTISGYIADISTIQAMTITPTSQNETLTVTYNAVDQVLTYAVIDDTSGETLAKDVELASGKSDEVLAPSVNDDYQAVIASYLAKGYVLVSATQLPTNYDNNSAVAQNVIIHLEHGQKTQAGANKVVTQTIAYIYGNGPKKEQSAAETYTKTYTFTSVETFDTVTGEVLATSWSAPQETQTVVSPTLNGYLPSQSEVASQTLTHESVDQTTTILYTVGPQSIQVHYVDVYGITPGEQGVELMAQLQTLTGEAGSTYTNKLWDYVAAGYELSGVQPEAMSGTFDEDPEAAQDYYVYLTHALRQVTGEPVTVSQTINYVYGSGPKAGQLAGDPIKSSQTFIPTYTIDQVTGQTVGTPTWGDSASITLDPVVSPTIAGYTPDKATVAETTLTPTSAPDNVITVTYEADLQRLTYTVIDDTSGETLVQNMDLASGKSDEVLPPSVNDDYQAVIASYLAKGYVLVSATQLPENFDNDSTLEQNVVLHLAHAQVQKAGPTKIVTQTVEYVYGDGPKQGQSVSAPYTSEYKFTSVETFDSVTGERLDISWSKAQLAKTVLSPAIDGYVPEQTEVMGQLLTHESADQLVVIRYNAGQQTVKIHYIDVNKSQPGSTGYTPSDGQEVTDLLQVLVGKTDAIYQNALRDVASLGYTLLAVPPEALQGSFDNDPAQTQAYYVYLGHDTMTTVGDPLTLTDTVNYVYGNGPQKGQPVTAPSIVTKTFIPTYTIDKVTGETIGVTWSGDGLIEAQIVPQITGYVPTQPILASRILTPEMVDQTQTVYYLLEENDPSKEVVNETPTPDNAKGSRSSPTPETQAENVIQTSVTPADTDEVSKMTQANDQGPLATQAPQELPQMGDSPEDVTKLIGLGLLSSATLLGAAKRRKKKPE